jgi:dTDP-glucose pyrophosphorylase
VGYIRTDDARRISIGYGLEIGSDKQVIRLAEKPSRPWNDLLGVGSWIVRHSWFDQFRRTKPDASRKERDFVTVIQRMIDSFGLVLGVDLGGTFFNINTSTDYFQMLAALRPSSNDMAIGIAAQ